jgi:hypothetical protein
MRSVILDHAATASVCSEPIVQCGLAAGYPLGAGLIRFARHGQPAWRHGRRSTNGSSQGDVMFSETALPSKDLSVTHSFDTWCAYPVWRQCGNSILQPVRGGIRGTAARSTGCDVGAAGHPPTSGEARRMMSPWRR